MGPDADAVGAPRERQAAGLLRHGPKPQVRQSHQDPPARHDPDWLVGPKRMCPMLRPCGCLLTEPLLFLQPRAVLPQLVHAHRPR
jgi:hypothetical protein